MNVNAETDLVGTGLRLQYFDIFKGLSSVECADVSKLMRIRTYGSGSYVISETQSHRDVSCIVSGKVRSCAISRHDKQIYYEDLHAGMMFGELAAIDQRERCADCLSVIESGLLSVSGQRFLGTHRKAVSRKLWSSQPKGFITWNRGKHIIDDVSALIDYAEK